MSRARQLEIKRDRQRQRRGKAPSDPFLGAALTESIPVVYGCDAFDSSADSGGGELRVKFGTGSVGSFTDLLIARDDTAGDELIPPHARLAILQSHLSPNTGVASLVFRTNGDTGVAFRHEEADGLSSAYRQWEVETDSSRKLEYTFATPGGTTSYFIRCVGFEE
jgi:hypothetical protein